MNLVDRKQLQQSMQHLYDVHPAFQQVSAVYSETGPTSTRSKITFVDLRCIQVDLVILNHISDLNKTGDVRYYHIKRI